MLEKYIKPSTKYLKTHRKQFSGVRIILNNKIITKFSHFSAFTGAGGVSSKFLIEVT